jgi:flagellar protein FliJ
MEQSMRSQREFDATLERQPLSRGLAESERPVRRANEALVRQKQFQIHATRRRIAEIEAVIADFDRKRNALETEIHVEQKRTRFDDPSHFAFPLYAKALIARRDNLKRSVEGLKHLLDDTRSALTAASFEVEAAGGARAMSALNSEPS